eukprot:TRINITY_DN21912_c0_g1_i2.p2 TRINITY_DN21912_c0_g1~~TRINITY_DN21912_c0_g1_i2.p2  ORF type:complete len:303 (+),score=66.75 TRINITY_DN21912_c0_g1_i2:472-1380(+)
MQSSARGSLSSSTSGATLPSSAHGPSSSSGMLPCAGSFTCTACTMSLAPRARAARPGGTLCLRTPLCAYQPAQQTPLSPRLLAAELSPEVHAAAAKRAALEHWDAMGLQVLHRAMADTNRTEVRVQSMPAMPGAGVPEVNSLLLEARGGAAGDAFAVRQVSVDGLLAEQGLGARRVLWMHVDAEGMDAAVLRGAEATLAAGLIDYIDFEYHALWRRKRRRSSEKLRAAVQRLERFGFRCALLLPASSGPSRRLVPLSGPWWHPSYEFHRWSTVWCAHRRNGAVLAAALAFFNAPLQPASRPA